MAASVSLRPQPESATLICAALVGLVQRQVAPIDVVVRNVLGQQPAQMSLVEDNLKLSRSKIYDMAQRGEIPCSKVVGRWRFFRAGVNEWLLQLRPARAGTRGKGDVDE